MLNFGSSLVSCVNVCLFTGCLALSLPNGQVNYNSSAVSGQYPVYTVASLTCNQGYYRGVTEVTTCQTSRDWEQPLPMCYDSNENILTSL